MLFRTSLLLAVITTGCGYHLRPSNNPILAEMGVKRVFIETVANRTFEPGVDIRLQTALERRIRAESQVVVVTRRELADAVLRAEVTNARYTAAGSTTGDRLYPTSLGAPFSLFTVANVYQAVLSCSVGLLRASQQKEKDQEQVLWKSDFSRSKAFPGNNQLDAYGRTSSLINETEFERALDDLATQVALEVHESLLGVF